MKFIKKTEKFICKMSANRVQGKIEDWLKNEINIFYLTRQIASQKIVPLQTVNYRDYRDARI